MGLLIAGDAGSVLVAAGRQVPGSSFTLAMEGLAEPVRSAWGTAHPTAQLPAPDGIDEVGLLPGEAPTRDQVTGWARTHGIPVNDMRLQALDPPDGIRVLAVSSPSTGSGKTAVTRKLARSLAVSGTRVAVLRHPIASLLHWPDRGGLRVAGAVEDLQVPGPVDEMEEIAPLLGTKAGVYGGLDPDAALRAAAAHAKVVVWDGGGAAMPWIRADIHVAVVDILRDLGPLAREHVESADAIVLTKSEAAAADLAREREAAVRAWNPDAPAYLVDMPIAVSDGPLLNGRHAVVVEDAASMMLGGLKAGAGAVAARRFRCGVVDPRPHAVGAIRRAFDDHPHIGPVIPSLGRTPTELEDLRATVAATPGEVVLWASGAPPGIVIPNERRPVVVAVHEVMEVAGGSLQDIIRPLMPGQDPLSIRRRPR